MVRCTEGAAYAANQRARQRLKSLDDDVVPLPSPTSRRGGNQVDTLRDAKVGQVAVEKILHALNTGDVQEFLGVMSEHIHNDGTPGFQEFGKQEVRSNSGQGLPSGLHASYQTLWDRDIILVLAETDEGLAIHNIAYPVVEGGELVYFRGYYFCQELLYEVGRSFGIPVQKKKPAVQWV